MSFNVACTNREQQWPDECVTELRVADNVGVSVIGGVRTFHDEDTNQRISLFEGGASGRYYVTGSFRGGLQVAAEAVYVKAQPDLEMTDIKAAGLGLSPFLGYTWTHSSGFTREGSVRCSICSWVTASDRGSRKHEGPRIAARPLVFLVEPRGIEPLTSRVRF